MNFLGYFRFVALGNARFHFHKALISSKDIRYLHVQNASRCFFKAFFDNEIGLVRNILMISLTLCVQTFVPTVKRKLVFFA